MRGYTQLTETERYQIYALMKLGHTQTEIAGVLDRCKSTISRELARNRGLRGYRPAQAQRLCRARRAAKPRARLAPAVWDDVERLLREDWSPEQISLWLAEERRVAVSHEWIYQHVLADQASGGDLHRHLRCQKARRKRYGHYDRRGSLPDRVSIDERPAVVERRARFGDWELDTLIGKGHRGALVSLTERRSRLALLVAVPTKQAEVVAEAVLEALGPLREEVHTLTADNGREFALHALIAETLEAKFYFAHPYASWQRGLNENTNGLIRQYFPKRRDFTTITDAEVQAAMDKLNNRPRKCLGMKTPNQVFFGINPPVALAS